MTSEPLAAMMQKMDDSIISFQIVLVDRLTPVLREASYRLGRWALEWYLTWPWYRRLAFDLSSGRFIRTVLEDQASLAAAALRALAAKVGEAHDDR